MPRALCEPLVRGGGAKFQQAALLVVLADPAPVSWLAALS
jgi:hypothetical protein